VIQSTDIEIANVAKRDAGFGHFPMREDPDRILAIIGPVLAHIAGKAA
jgi:hypothetical protein